MITGASAASMKLQAFTKDDKLVCDLDNDDALLGSYHVDDGMRIHVSWSVSSCVFAEVTLSACHALCFLQATDTAHRVGEFEDLSKVEKYEMSEDDYAKRSGADGLVIWIFLLVADAVAGIHVVKSEVKKKKIISFVSTGNSCENNSMSGSIFFLRLGEYQQFWWT